jgi:hypothetical protein
VGDGRWTAEDVWPKREIGSLGACFVVLFLSFYHIHRIYYTYNFLKIMGIQWNTLEYEFNGARPSSWWGLARGEAADVSGESSFLTAPLFSPVSPSLAQGSLSRFN